MGVVFSVRGDDLDAYHSSAEKSPVLASNVNILPRVIDDATTGVIGGKTIEFPSTTGFRFAGYNARENLPTNGKISILWRFQPLWSGNPGGLRSMFKISAGTSNANGSGRIVTWWNTGGSITAQVNDWKGGNRINGNSNYLSMTAGQVYDFVLTHDGEATAGACEMFLDGVTLTSIRSSIFTGNINQNNLQVIAIGDGTSFGSPPQSQVNEFVIWDEIIDPTPSGLNLIGSARSEFITTTAFDGANYTDPTVGKVSDDTSYIFAGNTLTGTVGASVDPGVVNVRENIEYKIDGSTLTGILTTPTPASGAAGTIDINSIKENIRYVLEQANTITASPVYLSDNLANDAKVQNVFKIHPENIPVQASKFPFVTVYTDGKIITPRTIAKNQLSGKKEGTLEFQVVGALWNDNYTNFDEDPADEDIENLMENIELTLRAYSNLGGTVLFAQSKSVSYHNLPIDEKNHLRAGMLTLEAKILY